MIVTELSAQALYEVAVAEQTVMATYQALQDFSVLVADENVQAVFIGALFDENVREELPTILQTSFSAIMVNFIMILVEAHLISYHAEIVRSFEYFMVKDRYLNDITIISATPLSKTEEAAILKLITAQYPEPYRLEVYVDASLIQGYVIHVNQAIYDTSIKHKLQQIQNQGGLLA